MKVERLVAHALTDGVAAHRVRTIEDKSEVAFCHSSLTNRTVGDERKSMSKQEIALSNNVALEVCVTAQTVVTATRQNHRQSLIGGNGTGGCLTGVGRRRSVCRSAVVADRALTGVQA